MDSNEIYLLIKALGKRVVMELVKSKWVKFCIGVAILFFSAPGFIRAIAELGKVWK